MIPVARSEFAAHCLCPQREASSSDAGAVPETERLKHMTHPAAGGRALMGVACCSCSLRVRVEERGTHRKEGVDCLCTSCARATFATFDSREVVVIRMLAKLPAVSAICTDAGSAEPLASRLSHLGRANNPDQHLQQSASCLRHAQKGRLNMLAGVSSRLALLRGSGWEAGMHDRIDAPCRSCP
jgi:hypothetical protein